MTTTTAGRSLEDLQNDKTIWGRKAIARELDVELDTVDQWHAATRRHLRNNEEPPPGSFPVSEGDGVSAWYAGTIRTWAMQTGRMAPDGTALRATSPGRPVGSGAKRVA